ncbi:MAG TPA: aminotransferase class III-fold pyridoxal phosphate-dependent enzyme [Gemmataceae bacterium]|nr:aminotransferase class III-fold pyridoxal phosphate-dependent enzyme [Gemmataceae bacterium]
MSQMILDAPNQLLSSGTSELPALAPLGRREPRRQESSEGHPFARCVNPYLADMLNKLWLDKRFVRGEGCELIDDTGRRYLDGMAAYGALPFGFNPPEIWRSVLEVQRSGEPSFVQPSLLDAAGELAERLLAVAPANLRYVTFANSGAEAVEAAVKMCRVATGRLGILATNNSFHGKTLGALSATGNAHYQDGFGAPAGDFRHIPFGDATALRQELETHPGYYAAFLVEPIQGEGGVIVPPSGYLAEVRDLCTKAGVLLVLDEIQTGLGRTGTLFACETEGVQPDVMTLAKALGGGLLPIGAVLSSEKAFSELFALKHSSTFAANALACRAGLASLDLLTRDDGALVRRVARNGARLKEGLLALQRRFPQLIAEVRGRGFLLGLRFAADRANWPESLLGVALEQEFFTPLFASYMLNVEAVRVAPTLNGKAVLRIEPALTMSWPQCERLLSALERALIVFAGGDTGRILASILEGRSCPPARSMPLPKPWLEVKPRPAERRFAFLMHPLDYANAVDFDPSLAYLDAKSLETVVRKVAPFVEPFVVSHGRVVSATGETIYGEFITLPRTAEELARMRRKEAIEYVRKALHLARDRGAQLVGLGAFTSVVTLGGRAVAEEGVPVTTGNSYTAVASAEATRKALALVGRGESTPPAAAIIGATGAIGRVLALLLAEDVGRLILVGNPDSSAKYVRERLLATAGDVLRFVSARHAEGSVFRPGTFAAQLLTHLPGGVVEQTAIDAALSRMEQTGWLALTQETTAAVRRASVVVTATSATGTVVRPEDLRRRAVVCDVSRPANVGREILETRPDVLVIDGGVIAVPTGSALSRFGLGDGLIYGCMAETMMLTLAGHLCNTSLGTDLAPEMLHQLRTLADKHGFHVAKLRSFGRPLEEADFHRLRSAGVSNAGDSRLSRAAS